jgi:hypothetical protein
MRKPALSGVISSLMLMGTVGLLALRFVLYRRDGTRQSSWHKRAMRATR